MAAGIDTGPGHDTDNEQYIRCTRNPIRLAHPPGWVTFPRQISFRTLFLTWMPGFLTVFDRF